MQVLLDSLEQQAADFYFRLASRADEAGIDIADMRPDHLCYRVETIEDYYLAKAFFCNGNELITETEIRGRPISTFRLSQPLKFGSDDVSLLELPAPQVNRFYKNGFEHAEYVIEEPFELMLRRYPALQERFEIRNNPFNPELVLQFADCSLKFHYKSLDQVIDFEKSPLLKKQLIVFDLDGTLIDSVSDIDKVNRNLLRKLGVSESQLYADPFPSNFPELLKKFGLLHVDHEEFAQQWGVEMLKTQPSLIDGVVELLEKIARLEIPMAVWTARDRQSALTTLENLDIGHYFKRVWGFKKNFSKPQPEGLRFLSEGRPREFITFIGDSPTDASAAENFGCTFYWAQTVLKSHRSREDFIERLATAGQI